MRAIRDFIAEAIYQRDALGIALGNDYRAGPREPTWESGHAGTKVGCHPDGQVGELYRSARYRPRVGKGRLDLLYHRAVRELPPDGRYQVGYAALEALLAAARAYADDALRASEAGERTVTVRASGEMNAALQAAIRFAEGMGPKKAAPVPLTETQQAVYDLIKRDGPIQGDAICRRLAVSQSTLTRHIIPALKSRAVKNRRCAGYYIDPST
jgi:hypothetical protein